jgi:hypothetical protein
MPPTKPDAGGASALFVGASGLARALMPGLFRVKSSGADFSLLFSRRHGIQHTPRSVRSQ